MGKVFKIDPPKKDSSYNIFFISDLHSHHLHEPTYNIFKKHARILDRQLSKTIVIIGGDFLDAEFLMKSKNEHYARNLKNMSGMDDYFVPEAESEIAWGNKILDEISELADMVIFMQGNHDWRYEAFMNSDCPNEYKHNFNLDKQLKLEERNISHIMYNDWLDVGDYFCATHGMFHGVSALKKHWEACGGKNVIFGHVHKAESKAFPVRGDTTMSWSNPAMCHLNPHYIKNTDNNWSTGYSTIHMRCDGKFTLYPHVVIDNKLMLPSGEILVG